MLKVHPKTKILSLITNPHVVHFWNTKEDLFDEIWVFNPSIDRYTSDTGASKSS